MMLCAPGQVTLTEQEILVRFQKRAHNPLLLAAGFPNLNPPLPWLGRKRWSLKEPSQALQTPPLRANHVICPQGNDS
jgi:hypothetical protein